MRRAAIAAWLVALGVAAGCSSDEEQASASDVVTDVLADTNGGDPGTQPLDVTTPDTGPEVSVDTTPTPDVGPDVELDIPPAPEEALRMANRGLIEVRAIIHLHSAYSHDACDDEGLAEDGTPNWPCIRRMKAALCKERIAVAFMTDHPSHMADQPFLDLLYPELEAGDVLLEGEDGAPIGILYPCPEGQGGPDGWVRLVPGAEGHHGMPLGLERHVPNRDLYGVPFRTETSDESLLEVTTAIRKAGGFVTIAHSEDDDLDWETIAAHDIPAMELYNFHANFQQVLSGSALVETIFELEPFLDYSGDGAASDLIALIMLDQYPEPALEKWRRVSVERPITAMAGSDVHENVILPALCAGDLCDGLVEEGYPNLATALAVEGPLWMPDGERIDSYGRIFRWVQNRAWIDPDADILQATKDALEAGRVQVIFEVLGPAIGAELVAVDAAGEATDMGSTVQAPATLKLRAPDSPGDGAAIDAVLVRTDAKGSTEVATWTEPGAWLTATVDEPGSYHLEVWITPGHLAAPLGAAGHLAERRFRWVETNAIRVE